MKKIVQFVFILSFTTLTFSQIDDRLTELSESYVDGYMKPLVTTLGTGLNSGSYYTAAVPSLFGFTFSIKGMAIFIPEDDKVFDPQVPNTPDKDLSATIFGDRGGAYLTPDGFVTLPPGINQSSIPLAYPQVSFAYFGTELMVRYLPSIDLGEKKLNFWGLGFKHSISNYIPLFPVDIAAQITYNSFGITDIIKHSNLAFNVHASKSFGVLILYGGLQYENSSMDLEYTLEGDPEDADPGLRVDKDVKMTIDGDNHFRLTLGTALKLSVLVLNFDFNIGAQSALTGGLNLAF